MSRFLESICCKSAAYQQLALHQKRVDETFDRYFPKSSAIQLEKILPEPASGKRKKVRIIYDNNHFDIDVRDYEPKVVSQLKLLDANDLNYSFKFADRSSLDELMKLRGTADDILIIQNGKITDSSYANVIFWDGSEWNTPNTYLLNGVKRQMLLQEDLIKESEILVNDLQRFSKVGLINAMLDPGEVTLPISRIIG